MMLRDAYVFAIEQENERLRERVAVLEMELCGGVIDAPLEWGLTGSETRVVGVILSREIATRDAIMAALYRDLGRDEADLKIVDVLVCKVRSKLKPFEIQIGSKWGIGYFMLPDAKARVRERLATFRKVA